MLTLSRRTTGRCSVFCSTMNASSANGAPTKKHHRQPSHDVSTIRPPSNGPLIVASAKVAPR